MLNRRQHAHAARALIDACGGLDEAVKACRLGKPALSKAQHPHHEYYLPADVIGALESYCGDPVYSRELLQSVAIDTEGPDVVQQSCDLTLASAQLGYDLHQALDDKVLSNSEQDRLRAILITIKSTVTQLDNHIKSGRIPETPPNIRAVPS